MHTALALATAVAATVAAQPAASAEPSSRTASRAQAELLLKEADRNTSATAAVPYVRAAWAFLEHWRRFFEVDCLDRKPTCYGSEEALFRAARAFSRADLQSKAIAVYRMLLNPDYHLHRTELGLAAGVRVAEAYLSSGWFDRAAEFYERHAVTAPERHDAPQALAKAITLWLRLGEVERAVAAARRFERTYGRRRAAQAVRLNVAISERLVDLGQWQEADLLLSRVSRQLETRASLEVLLRARVAQARASAGLGNEWDTLRRYAQVRDAWQNPQVQVRRLDALGGDATERRRRLGQVLTLVGEAHYHLADADRMLAMQPWLPAYRGLLRRQRVRDYLARQIRPWMAARQRAIRAAEARHLGILELRPVPPPKWVTASHAAVAGLWRHAVAELDAGPCSAPAAGRSARSGRRPVPDVNALRRWCRAELGRVTAPLLLQAKSANLRCLRLSVDYQQFDDRTRACETWLAARFPREFPVLDEVRPQPNRLPSPLDQPMCFVSTLSPPQQPCGGLLDSSQRLRGR